MDLPATVTAALDALEAATDSLDAALVGSNAARDDPPAADAMATANRNVSMALVRPSVTAAFRALHLCIQISERKKGTDTNLTLKQYRR